MIVSNDLHDSLSRSGRMGDARFEPVPQSDDWYCEVETLPSSRPAADPALGAVLAEASAVILGFEGPVVPLYTASQARAAVRNLMDPITEARSVEDAIEGRAPLATSLERYEGSVHPMDLLRALQDHAVAGELRSRLHLIERQRLANARPTPRLPELLAVLAEQGLAVAVAGDTDSGVMAELLARRGLDSEVAGGVHGRRVGAPLLPDPDCLHRALSALEIEPERGVMVGSSAAELIAARQIGLPFIGYRRDKKSHGRLLTHGCELTVASLAPLIDAVRTG